MRPTDIIHKSWEPIVGALFREPLVTLNNDILPNIAYLPKREQIFNVFKMPVKDIKVVILGQDPYPTPGDAIGYAFAVPPDRKTPKSLQVILEEIVNSKVQVDEKVFIEHKWKTLQHWRKQGVFLLNTALTVESGNSGSHLKHWQDFVRGVIGFISAKNPAIWLLWGRKAQLFVPYMKGEVYPVSDKYTDKNIHQMPANPFYNYIISTPHPAAELYSKNAGFSGSKCFSIVNQILFNNRNQQILW